MTSRQTNRRVSETNGAAFHNVDVRVTFKLEVSCCYFCFYFCFWFCFCYGFKLMTSHKACTYVISPSVALEPTAGSNGLQQKQQ